MSTPKPEVKRWTAKYKTNMFFNEMDTMIGSFYLLLDSFLFFLIVLL